MRYTDQAQGSSHSSRNNFQAKASTEQGSWKALMENDGKSPLVHYWPLITINHH